VPLPHQALQHSSFSPFPEFKVPILTSFFKSIIIEISLPSFSDRRLAPSEKMGDLFSIIYFSILTHTICIADCRPVIRAPVRESQENPTDLSPRPERVSCILLIVYPL
jgi:hypothetical protein